MVVFIEGEELEDSWSARQALHDERQALDACECAFVTDRVERQTKRRWDKEAEEVTEAV